MDIQAFVRESLHQILDGVVSAKKTRPGIAPVFGVNEQPHLPDTHLISNGGGRTGVVFFVEFDIAVSAREGPAPETGAKLHIAGGTNGHGADNSLTSRIKFLVPVSYRHMAD